MKTYSDFMDEISQSDVYEGLLGYGLFSSKLPPVLSSEEFYNYCIIHAPMFADVPRSQIFYESIRNTNVPRQLGIPNPMAYQLLCKCISDNWGSLQLHFRQKTRGQKYNVSHIHLRKMVGTKALFKMNYESWKTDGAPEPDLLIGSRFVVRADISTCFPSIYTHSIPWALVGKSTAKQQRKKNLWFNQIDHLTQNCKFGETHGLLIGPHASNLIGEIILTSIDYELTKKWNYIRHIDDYTCFVESYEKAQLFLTELSSALRQYDLTLNHKKTQISALPLAMTEQWKRQIGNPNSFLKNGIMDYLGVRSYLDSIIEVMQKNNENSAILNYAIKALPAEKMSSNAADYCVKTVFHLCLMYPYLSQIMDEFVFSRFNVTVDQIKDLAERLYKQELSNKNYDGVCYSLFYAIKHGFIIDSLNVDDVIDSDSCVFRLLAHMYYKKHGFFTEEKILMNLAQALKTDENDFNQNWLFEYEVLSQNDLPDEWKD